MKEAPEGKNPGLAERHLARRTGDRRVPAERLAAIYHTALLRDPRPEELAFATTAPADLLWSVLAQPEFQLIR